ncbi:hypothetical protein FOZ61_006137 [Perkinsus olseni]|uniref:Uncharacterized protein n=1 Tax=Perkinsus olseni TaxID=32597 RepID=A0A7J6LEN5_PEROL|nr:hypothetical protein FOZ61_006137 [Perkinsus olseni]
MLLLFYSSLLLSTRRCAAQQEKDSGCFGGWSSSAAAFSSQFEGAFDRLEAACAGVEPVVPPNDTMLSAVGEALGYLSGIIEFRTTNLVIAEEVVDSMEELLRKMPPFPCNQTLSSIIAIRTDALQQAITLARQAYSGGGGEKSSPIEAVLDTELCRICSGLPRENPSSSLVEMNELFNALNSFYTYILSVDRAFIYGEVEGVDPYCVPAAIWAFGEAGVNMAQVAETYEYAAWVTELTSPLFWYSAVDDSSLGHTAPWEQLVDRLVLPFVRIVAKLVYELQLITAMLNSDYRGHRVAQDLFVERNFLPDLPYKEADRRLFINDGGLAYSSSHHHTLTVIHISNLTARDTIHNIKSSPLVRSSDSTLWLEDSFREPWYHNLRPTHLGITLEASGDRQSLCWRRHSATEPGFLALINDCLPRGWPSSSEIRLIDATERWRVDDRTWEWKTSTDRPTGMTVSTVNPGPPNRSTSFERIFEEYKAIHAEMIANPTARSSRFLVFSCNPWSLCGGHGDRINGISTAFVLALLTGRALLLDVDSPIPLGLLLQPLPDSIDWRIPPSGVGAHPSVFVYVDNRKRLIRDLPFIANDTRRVMIFSHNHRDIGNILESEAFRKSPAALAIREVEHLTSEIWRCLFQPTIHLARHIERATRATFGTDNPGSFIAVHFRSGDRQLDKWWDPKRHGLETLNEFLACAARVEEELGLSAAHTKWFLSSDTEDVFDTVALREHGAKIVRLRIDETDEGEEIVHIDRSSDVYHQFTGVTLSYVNYYILQKAAAIVLSRSFFGETAAEIGRIRHAYFYHGCVRTSLISSWPQRSGFYQFMKRKS